MTRIDAADAASRLQEPVRLVEAKHASFESNCGGCGIGRLVPTGPPKRVKASQPDDIFASFQKLGDDSEVFEREIAGVQTALVQDRDPWAVHGSAHVRACLSTPVAYLGTCPHRASRIRGA